MTWSNKHRDILKTFMRQLDQAGIKFFIIRNYEGLPERNTSKDVDIVVKHGAAKTAEAILKKVFKDFELIYYYRVRIEESLLCRAVNADGSFAIHFDLMNGYINRGVELFSFDELYNHTIDYHGFRVLDELYNGIMLFVYKQFGYKQPFLKITYQKVIYDVWNKYPEFSSILGRILGNELYQQISENIRLQDFDELLSHSREVDKKLREYSNSRDLLKNIYRRLLFILRKIERIIIHYRKYEKSFSVMAPDGTGKTTFLDALMDRLADIYVDAPAERTRFHLYHFRPMLIPNLGVLGEKAGMMKQDTDFTHPHRAKPVGVVSSLFRLTYYWMDYVLGWMYYTRRDVQYDHYTIYDRYSYDLLVDPERTRLHLPFWIRQFFVKCMPHPKVNFFLHADPTTIIQRKAELTLVEIVRQNQEYKKLAACNNRIITVNANHSVESMVGKATTYLLEKYWIKI